MKLHVWPSATFVKLISQLVLSFLKSLTVALVGTQVVSLLILLTTLLILLLIISLCHLKIYIQSYMSFCFSISLDDFFYISYTVIHINFRHSLFIHSHSHRIHSQFLFASSLISIVFTSASLAPLLKVSKLKCP